MEEKEESLFPCPFIGKDHACTREGCEFFQECMRSFFKLAAREFPTLETLVESLLNKEIIFDEDFDKFLNALADAFSKAGFKLPTCSI